MSDNEIEHGCEGFSLLNIVLVPLNCRCVVQPDSGRFGRIGTPKIYMCGMPIRDAISFATRIYNSDQEVAVEFCGTAIVYTSGGLLDGIAQVRQGPVEVWLGDSVGVAEEFEIEIGEVVTMVPPSGQVVQLIGADR